jgi:hypothetical protein
VAHHGRSIACDSTTVLSGRPAQLRRYVARALRKEQLMLEFIMLAIALGFFALSVGYTIVCDRL